MDTNQKLPTGFDDPTALPEEHERQDWQQQNKSWWEKNPRRYDWKDKIGVAEFSKEFYQEIDHRFFQDSRHYLPWKERPFDQLIPFSQLPAWDVLEIGVGNGSHAQLIAPHCKSYIGVDLTQYAVTSTSQRFETFGIKGTIRQMDAEKMEFPDESFNFIWTWGVIHHSANTGAILEHMHRVLKPGGQTTIMVYHRSFYYTYIFTAFLRGVLAGGFRKAKSIHELLQLTTDGAIARFYLPKEWQDLVESKGFTVEQARAVGQKSEFLPLPAGGLKNMLMKLVPDVLSRFLLNTLWQGSFLITTLRKR
jgi:ubiquinone/menaquinone biosynthesis C-methylase UbiE